MANNAMRDGFIDFLKLLSPKEIFMGLIFCYIKDHFFRDVIGFTCTQ